MDLPKFIGENSGKSNPIANWASHATQDYALYDQIGLTRASRQLKNQLRVQSFRMNDLMDEIQNAEVPSNNTISSVPQSSMNVSTANGPNQYVNERVDTHQFSPQFGIPMQEVFFPINPMSLSGSGRYPYDRHQMRKCVKCVNKQLEEIRKSAEFRAKVEEEKLNENKNKSEKVNKEAKETKKVFYFDGLRVEEAFHAPAPDVEWSEAENFYLFVSNNKKKVMNFDVKIEMKFKFSENNPYLDIADPLSQGLKCYREGDYSQAILFYEAAVQKDKNCIVGLQQLIFALRNDGRTPEAVYLVKKCLPLDPDYFSRVLYSIFISEQYYYQGCQIILRWLKNHPGYRDLVPPNFTLEDKTSNLIEKEQLTVLQNILLKAVQRSPFRPNYYVLSALSLLHEISRDYTKANACLVFLSKCDPSSWKGYEFIIGLNLLRNNEPHKAILQFDDLKLSIDMPLCRSHCEHGIGLTYMFLKDYETAAKCLLAGLYFSKMTYTVLWIHLLLCTQLMKRNDLINLVKNENFDQLCREFDFTVPFTRIDTSKILHKIRKRPAKDSPQRPKKKRGCSK